MRIDLYQTDDPDIAVAGGAAGKAGDRVVVVLPAGVPMREWATVLAELLDDAEFGDLTAGCDLPIRQVA